MGNSGCICILGDVLVESSPLHFGPADVSESIEGQILSYSRQVWRWPFPGIYYSFLHAPLTLCIVVRSEKLHSVKVVTAYNYNGNLGRSSRFHKELIPVIHEGARQVYLHIIQFWPKAITAAVLAAILTTTSQIPPGSKWYLLQHLILP